MKSLLRMALMVLLVIVIATTWSACSSDGYDGSGTVYVSHGYSGYGPGWGYGWGGYGGYGGYGGGYYGPGW